MTIAACSGNGPHGGNVHEYQTIQIAKLDGTPVQNAPVVTTYVCEQCYPDPSDPKFVLCGCRLCRERRTS